MIYADLHIHIGRSLDGKAVKVTGSPALTLPAIIDYAVKVKGLDMIGIVDAHSPGVRKDFRELLDQGMMKPLAGGGYRSGSLVVIPGMETELKVGEGHAHFLAFFSALERLESYLAAIAPYTRNLQLSSQKLHLGIEEWIDQVEKAEGLWLPAHAFTPHKGILGACCRRLKDVLPVLPGGLEMGLSADRRMALALSELDNLELLSNSDAHSLPNIGREYNAALLQDNSFSGLSCLLKHKEGRIVRHYGMNPIIGKYHRTYCPECSKVIEEAPPVTRCPFCQSKNIVMGVLDRLLLIADRSLNPRAEDPRYIYRVPLRMLPGIGPKNYERLIKHFGSEIAVYHQASFQELVRVIGEKQAVTLEQAQAGKLRFLAGGGGLFGKVET